MSDQLQSLYDRHIGLSWEKQLALQAWAGELDWQFDMEQGALAFSDGSCWTIQILGTESEVSETWQWAWANEQSDLPLVLTRFARMLLSFGEDNSIAEFVSPSSFLDDFHGDYLALIGSGICQAQAYYRCSYDGGAMYVLMDDPNLPSDRRPVVQRVISTFPHLVAHSDVADHQAAFESYLQAHHLDFASKDAIIEVQVSGSKVLEANFDRYRRLVRLDASF